MDDTTISVYFLQSSQEGNPEIPESIIESAIFQEKMALFQNQVVTVPRSLAVKVLRVQLQLALKTRENNLQILFVSIKRSRKLLLIKVWSLTALSKNLNRPEMALFTLFEESFIWKKSSST